MQHIPTDRPRPPKIIVLIALQSTYQHGRPDVECAGGHAGPAGQYDRGAVLGAAGAGPVLDEAGVDSGTYRHGVRDQSASVDAQSHHVAPFDPCRA